MVRTMFQTGEIKKFLLRGNVVDLAVGVVIGIAFGAVVTSLVGDIITPLIAAAIGEPDFSGLTFTVNEAVFGYGNFINAVVNFVLVAAAIFFFVVKPMQATMSRRQRAEVAADPPSPSEEILLLREIRDLLQKP